MLTRYQHTNHLGSSSLETDSAGVVISYEEYHPFGTTAYQATLNTFGSSAKRYRFCGKEKDEESGLYYYGARYYASWLGRFVSVDALKDKYPQWSSYQYTGNNPVTFYDLDGNEPTDNEKTNVRPPDTSIKNDNTRVEKGGKVVTVKKEDSVINQVSKTNRPKGYPELKPGKRSQPITTPKPDMINKVIKKVKDTFSERAGLLTYRDKDGAPSNPLDEKKRQSNLKSVETYQGSIVQHVGVKAPGPLNTKISTVTQTIIDMTENKISQLDFIGNLIDIFSFSSKPDSVGYMKFDEGKMQVYKPNFKKEGGYFPVRFFNQQDSLNFDFENNSFKSSKTQK